MDLNEFIRRKWKTSELLIDMVDELPEEMSKPRGRGFIKRVSIETTLLLYTDMATIYRVPRK